MTLWVALIRPRLWPAYALWAAALHTGIWLTIGINYVSWAVTVAVVFVDWPAVVERVFPRNVDVRISAVR